MRDRPNRGENHCDAGTHWTYAHKSAFRRFMMRAHSERTAPAPPWPPRVQVAGVSSLEEALFCHRVGVDALGFTLELPSGLHDGLTADKARVIIEQLPSYILPVVITYHQTAAAACQLVQNTGGKALQFHGGISEDEIGHFRDLCPGIHTIVRVTVRDEAAMEKALQFKPPLWDAIILDSFDPETGRLGATGLTHNWSISARIVQQAQVPVILAGGLNPDNVGEAIRIVRPHGVDAHTGLENLDGSRNFEKIRAFALQALAAFQEQRS